MSWVAPVAKNVARYAIKYGPHAAAAWEVAGKHVKAAARDKSAAVSARRAAFRHAETLVDGSVLAAFHEGQPIWIVFSRDEPVAAHPTVKTDLAPLVASCDLTKRETSEQHRDRQLAQRARRRVSRRKRQELPGLASGEEASSS